MGCPAGREGCPLELGEPPRVENGRPVTPAHLGRSFGRPVVRTGFEQQDAGGGLGTQAIGQHGTARSRADHDVVPRSRASPCEGRREGAVHQKAGSSRVYTERASV